MDHSSFIPIWYEIGSENDNWYAKTHDDHTLNQYYRICSLYTVDELKAAKEIIVSNASVSDDGFPRWFSPVQFKDALEVARSQLATQVKGDYCPCCSNTGVITASKKQTRDRWEEIEVNRPEYFKLLIKKGIVKVKDGKIKGVTAMFACGCREVDTSTTEDRKEGTPRRLAKFLKYFPEDYSKCVADSECNPTPGVGKNLCPISSKHHAGVMNHRLELVKEDPFYEKGLKVRNRIAEIRTKEKQSGGFRSAGEILG